MTTRNRNDGADSRDLLTQTQYRDTTAQRLRRLEQRGSTTHGGVYGGGDPHAGGRLAVPLIVTVSTHSVWTGVEWVRTITLTLAYTRPDSGFAYLEAELAGGAGFHRFATTPSTAATWEISDSNFRPNDSSYQVRLRAAVEPQGLSEWSEWYTGIFFDPNPLQPPAPADLRPDATIYPPAGWSRDDGGGLLAVAWEQDGLDSIDRFLVHYWRVSAPEGRSEHIVYPDPAATTQRDILRSLPLDEPIHVEVVAQRGEYTSNLSNIVIVTVVIPPPPPPTGVEINPTFGTGGYAWTGNGVQAGLRWTLPGPSGDRDHLDLEWWETAEPTHRSPLLILPGTATGWMLEPLIRNVPVQAHVRAVPRWGPPGEWSVALPFTPPPENPPAPTFSLDTAFFPPNGLQFLIDYIKIALAITPPTPPPYLYWLKVHDDTRNLTLFDNSEGVQPRTTFAPLLWSTTYTITLWSMTRWEDRSTTPATVSFTTAAQVFSPPTNLLLTATRADNAVTGAAHWTWVAPVYPTAYIDRWTLRAVPVGGGATRTVYNIPVAVLDIWMPDIPLGRAYDYSIAAGNAGAGGGLFSTPAWRTTIAVPVRATLTNPSFEEDWRGAGEAPDATAITGWGIAATGAGAQAVRSLSGSPTHGLYLLAGSSPAGTTLVITSDPFLPPGSAGVAYRLTWDWASLVAWSMLLERLVPDDGSWTGVSSWPDTYTPAERDGAWHTHTEILSLAPGAIYRLRLVWSGVGTGRVDNFTFTKLLIGPDVTPGTLTGASFAEGAIVEAIGPGTLPPTVLSGAVPVAGGGTGATTAPAGRAALGAAGRYETDIGDGSSTSITVTHSLNKRPLAVTIMENATNDLYFTNVNFPTLNTAVFSFAVAPAAAAYHIILTG